MTVHCKKCGREADVVIGTFALCPVCDRPAAPVHVDPEKTEPYPAVRTATPQQDDLDDYWRTVRWPW